VGVKIVIKLKREGLPQRRGVVVVKRCSLCEVGFYEVLIVVELGNVAI
jgi:hypothetical protein